MPGITVTWRDECYGSRSDAKRAFRIYQALTPAEQTLVSDVANRNGFAWDNKRASWISRDPQAHHGFATAMADHGVSLVHSGHLTARHFL